MVGASCLKPAVKTNQYLYLVDWYLLCVHAHLSSSGGDALRGPQPVRLSTVNPPKS